MAVTDAAKAARCTVALWGDFNLPLTECEEVVNSNKELQFNTTNDTTESEIDLFFSVNDENFTFEIQRQLRLTKKKIIMN
jgi:hypothetical protein